MTSHAKFPMVDSPVLIVGRVQSRGVVVVAICFAIFDSRSSLNDRTMLNTSPFSGTVELTVNSSAVIFGLDSVL